MKDIIKVIEDNKLFLRLSKEIYKKDALLAAAYKLTDRCVILIEPGEDEYFNVYFEPKGHQFQSLLEEVAKEFCNEVLDQQIQLDLEARYGNIREIIVQHAFSPLEDIKKAIKSSLK